MLHLNHLSFLKQMLPFSDLIDILKMPVEITPVNYKCPTQFFIVLYVVITSFIVVELSDYLWKFT